MFGGNILFKNILLPFYTSTMLLQLSVDEVENAHTCTHTDILDLEFTSSTQSLVSWV